MRVLLRVVWGLMALALVANWSPNPAFGLAYDESVHGDLSGTPAAPTLLGIAHVITLTGSAGGGDFDLFKLQLPIGASIDSIVLDSYSGTSRSFMAVQSNTSQWTAGLGGGVNATALLGWTHFGPAEASNGAGIGDNILDNMGSGFGATGFTPPITGASPILFLIQDTGGRIDYQMTIRMLTVPEPSGMVMSALAALCMIARRNFRVNP